MSKITPSPEIEDQLKAVFNIPDPDPRFIENLRGQLRARASTLEASFLARDNRPVYLSLGQRLSATFYRPAIAIPVVVLLIILMTILALGPQKVLAAIQGLLYGYSPDIGFVEDVHSILRETITAERGLASPAQHATVTDLTPQPDQTSLAMATRMPALDRVSSPVKVTVVNAVAEANRTVVIYNASGLPLDALSTSAENLKGESHGHRLRLKDGSLLQMQTADVVAMSDAYSMALEVRLEFPPLPPGVTELTLEIEQLPNIPAGKAPEDWRIPIQLTPTEQLANAGDVQRVNLSSQILHDFHLNLSKVSQSGHGTAFQLNWAWKDPSRVPLHWSPLKLTDEQGRYYIIERGPEGSKYEYSQRPEMQMSYQTMPISGGGPLTLSIDWMVLSVGSNDSLRFDPGPSVFVGQSWRLDQTIQAGDDTLRFTAARMKPGPNGYLLEFDVVAPAEITGVMLESSAGLSSETGFNSRGVLQTRLELASLPSQPLEIQVREVQFLLAGPWQVTWQPARVDFSGQPSTPAPSPSRWSPPFVLISHPILDEVKAQLERCYAPFEQGPGWLYFLQETTQPEINEALLDGTRPFPPPHRLIETWMYLDIEGLVTTLIVREKSTEDEVTWEYFQKGIFSFDFTRGEGRIKDELILRPLPFKSDLLNLLNYHVTQNHLIERQDEALEGGSSWVYTVRELYQPPEMRWGEAAPIKEANYRFWIDHESGCDFRTQTVYLFEDGRSKIAGTTQVNKLEWVESPPVEALELIEKVVMP